MDRKVHTSLEKGFGLLGERYVDKKAECLSLRRRE